MRVPLVAIAMYFSAVGIAADDCANAGTPQAAADRGPVDGDTNSPSAPGNDQSSRPKDHSRVSPLEEVLVTAQKRTERLEDVPVPVTVINSRVLLETGQVRLLDYYTRVPGLSIVMNDFRGSPALSIRGITTGGETNPTVGILVDDVPYGSSTNIGGGTLVSEIDPNEFARVEVLRGPQGTLYGVGSMGGLIKYVTVDPSTDGISGRIRVGARNIYNGDGPGYDVNGAVNVPISDTLAVRASAFARHEPGYIDDPVLHTNGVNWGEVNGGHFSSLWRPWEDFSLKLGALIQHTDFHGASAVNVVPGLRDLQQRSLLSDTGGYGRNNQIYTANLKANFRGIDLTSITAYTTNRYSHSYDASDFYGTLQQLYYQVPAVRYTEQDRTNSVTEELRLSGRAGERIDWLAGAFYTRERTRYTENNTALDPAFATRGVSVVSSEFPTTYEEHAVFGDLSLHFTGRFNLQIGGRESHNRQTFSQEYTGPFVPILFLAESPYITPEARSGDSSFTYLVTPQLKISRDLMTYARFASGYRAGGPNTGLPTQGLPAAYKPDSTENYEIGVKGDFLEHSLSFSSELYYVDWKDIQLSFFQGGFTYNANGSRAKSQGAQMSAEYQSPGGLSISAWAQWQDARLTEPLPAGSAVQANPGDPLPFSSRLSGRVSLGQSVRISRHVRGFIDGAFSYVSSFSSVFATSRSPQRQEFAGYGKIDLRTGLIFDSWTSSFFINNAADKRAAIGGGLGTTVPTTFFYLQPRVTGISISKAF